MVNKTVIIYSALCSFFFLNEYLADQRWI